MTIAIHPDAVPLRVDENGDIRVADTRILIDLVVREYEKGMSPEDIVAGYDVLKLADVYAVIAYYLRHKDEVTAYIRRREEEADQLERKIKQEMPLPPGFKEKLRAFREQQKREQDHAPLGER